MTVLSREERKLLEKATLRARVVAEQACQAALENLAVHEGKYRSHMSAAQRELRNQLRERGRALGDVRDGKNGAQDLRHVAEAAAYEQWHRLLFTRFLVENNLLITDAEHGSVPITLAECDELAAELGVRDGQELACLFASRTLPGVFRRDDPLLALPVALEGQVELRKVLGGLPAQCFQADDALGWTYQFWQAERKDEVNASGSKIGADELPAVTQLFTEDYMVDFLLDNTLGAWHAGKVLAAKPTLAEAAQSEGELRDAVALPGCPWKYLRFIKGKEGKWTPAAGTFDGWPKSAAALRALDPCMGSGHFVVAMFERLVALRVAEEKLDEAAAVAAVIRDNLFGLEIDPRCTQIGAFNLALAAWRRVGHCTLPAMNLACSGLAPNTREADWLAIAGDDERLRNGMERLYGLFENAPVLGSLINPRAGEGDLLVAAFHELQPLLEKALAQETKDDAAHEMAVTARGLAKAAEILAGQFTLVATNVPYLGRGKQDEVLMDYCERAHPSAKSDLATCFVERGLSFCSLGGSTAVVTPQNWLFLGTYRNLRETLLRNCEWDSVVVLGEGGFESAQAAGAFAAMVTLSHRKAGTGWRLVGIDVAMENKPEGKKRGLVSGHFAFVSQSGQMKNPDARIAFEEPSNLPLLSRFASGLQGISPADFPHYGRFFWEIVSSKQWEFWQSTIDDTVPFGGRELLLWWNNDLMDAIASGQAYLRGEEGWGKWGVVVRQMRSLPVSIFTGEKFDTNCAVIVPRNQHDLLAIWAFCCSPDFCEAVRRIDRKLNVTNATLVKVPFDLAHWQKVAAEKYPHGLPKPFSSDPTQWLFNGHPVGADQPLHVAVARLLGYQWPRQTGSSFPDCPALGPDGLETLADDDGLVPISPAKGEGPAAERLRELLARAYGKDWNASRQEALLAQVDYAGASLEDWLRNGFFEQHCALFHHRPFIWHVWDGHKAGFSALVNYHKLTHANLEKLTYSYLGNWIQRQQAGVAAEEAGSDAKLQAAKQLQATLKLILEGEPPYDIFVRWKPLSQQSIGWHPDLNDGVRMNIRPFAVADILRKRVKIKWDKDRGKEPQRDKTEYPWFWGWDGEKQDFAGIGASPDGNRWNDLHYTAAFKQKARGGQRAK